MAREMVWIKRIERWGCSDSAWAFDPSGPPVGNSIDEMGGIKTQEEVDLLLTGGQLTLFDDMLGLSSKKHSLPDEGA